MKMEKMSEEELLSYIPEDEKKELLVKSKRKEFLLELVNYIDFISNKLRYIKKMILSNDYHKITKECYSIARVLYKSAETIEKLPLEIGVYKDKSLSLAGDNDYIKFNLLENNVLHLTLKDSLPHTAGFRKVTQDEKVAYFDFYKTSYLSSFAKEFQNGRYVYYDEKVVIYIINHYIKEVDIDNYYYKYLIDAIKTFVMPDDSPKWCSMYADSIEDNKRYTETYIIPAKYFNEFICNLNKTPLD